jgi:hypothetical protein
MTEFLGKPASSLLEAEPFKSWVVERWVDDDADPPVVGYIFEGRGLQLNCDHEHELVRSVFLEAEQHPEIVLSEVPFNHSRAQVLVRFGSPSRSGERVSDPILGEFGPWDRFQLPEYTVHVQYEVESDTIAKITLMRNDVTP